MLCLILGVILQVAVAGFLIDRTQTQIQNRKSNFTLKEQFASVCNWKFISFLANNFLFGLSMTIVFVFLPDYAELKGLTKIQAVYLVSIIGISNAVGRLLNIPISLCHCNNGIVYAITCALSGVVVCVINIPVSENEKTFIFLAFACLMYGLMFGIQLANLVVVTNYLCPDRFLNFALGIAMMFNGTGSICGSPVAGLLNIITSFECKENTLSSNSSMAVHLFLVLQHVSICT